MRKKRLSQVRTSAIPGPGPLDRALSGIEESRATRNGMGAGPQAGFDFLRQAEDKLPLLGLRSRQPVRVDR
ncbi:hypothetical protein [Leptolyngbya sp. 'hensonii']|uniref:hypothetical protein n=1 Tax=Leptolyngbya sp. 'hensonii' TaxID=1922337 RepID=UPI000A63C529|nr:hypothetical protein [Leptolyngbya sp. 'hensonii']